MIIDTKTVVVTLVIVAIALYGGLQIVRQFALTIAQENLDANMAIDAADEAKRLKKERDADAAAASAFAKVEPLLPAAKITAPPSSGNSLSLQPAPSPSLETEPETGPAINTV
uniref:Uncharacterized protein n=1 Tax=Odontella aurita TaxID=265563 RepID=A0A7S4MVV3_9STRA|mmetsp:Transcript_35715/g.106589  ORF Transcript_35715/g.106589 Transcript_35715/m.106589 type:complete len:113 (+) Transcript_35715:206-544(+)|eukprot:CAMPEP_0113537056 /NCGR_PEP_ID=MMETSP0015_2-20120614/6615_1 /TAXON_ID=2838 /ORGANISM="Odontella" /LENGTH=112 /DNA_ID=CAMNT_0000436511 /DNA_START=171 /DNA_END=509 /DNA_ORIENTATION=- /assembly_acc=CAM_ASM_000160